MKKYKAFWSSSYFVESIGNISESTVRKYIRNPKINVKSTYKYKSIVKNQLKTVPSIIMYNDEKAKKAKKEEESFFYKNASVLPSNKEKQCSFSPHQNLNKELKKFIQ